MLLTTTDGELIITNTNNILSPLRAYNMTVGETHTYTVGEQGLWVHNTCDISKMNSSEKQALIDMAKHDKKTNEVTQGDMDAYKELNQGLPDPFLIMQSED